MQEWVKVTAAALPAAILLLIVIVFLRRCCSSKGRTHVTDETNTRSETLQSGIAKIHLAYDSNNRKNLANSHHHLLDSTRKGGYYVFRRGVSAKPLFSWADQPWLVSEAVEHGWSRFAFTVYTPSPSTRSTLSSFCAAGDQGREGDIDISWEVCPGSVDFMQKIRFNSGLKKANMGIPPLGASFVIKTALPLPGPPLGNSSFPQEAYFEITILSSPEEDVDSVNRIKKSAGEGELIKLIKGTADEKARSDSLIHVTSISGKKELEELKFRNKEEDGKSETVMLSVGLTGGGPLPAKLPGSYPGSIGFNSNGSVFLDGMKLVFESEKEEWEGTDKVIGCGFDPAQKKVFFTLDSELVHVINCKSEKFGNPLYPTLAANFDITVLVNLGQSAFKYAPANAHRTPNPCFIGPLATASAAALGYEDSRELFSMGRIDSLWHNRSTTRNNYGDNMAVDVDDESDLFEIVLDDCSRSPSTVVRNVGT